MRATRGPSFLALVLMAFLASLSSGCPHAGQSASQAPHASGVLLVKCPIADAELWVDSKYVRELREIKSGVRLSAGHHRIEVRHESYHSMYFDLDIGAGERRTLDVDLAPRLP